MPNQRGSVRRTRRQAGSGDGSNWKRPGEVAGQQDRKSQSRRWEELVLVAIPCGVSAVAKETSRHGKERATNGPEGLGEGHKEAGGVRGHQRLTASAAGFPPTGTCFQSTGLNSGLEAVASGD